MLVFIIAKIVFMLACREGHAFTVGDIYDVVAHGLTLDLSTALYFFIIPFLISMTMDKDTEMADIWLFHTYLTGILTGICRRHQPLSFLGIQA